MRRTDLFYRKAGNTCAGVEPRQRRSTRPSMAHEMAELLLEHAGTFLERTEAVKSAVALGMPLNEIEEYLQAIATNSHKNLV